MTSYRSSELLLQDECKGLSKFLASDPQSRRHVRERCKEINMGAFKAFDIRMQTAKQVVANLMRQYCHSVERMEVVGSSYIVDRTDSDIDVLVLLKSTGLSSLDQLVFDGWGYGGSVGVDGDKWMSWKKRTYEAGEVNILVTYDETYFNAWLTSAEVCRYLHLRGIVVPRAERVAIHNIIMDDSTADYENERK